MTTGISSSALNATLHPMRLRKRGSSASASSSMTRACERRIGWLANTLMSIVVIAVGITMIYYWTDICDRNPSWSYKCQNRA